MGGQGLTGLAEVVMMEGKRERRAGRRQQMHCCACCRRCCSVAAVSLNTWCVAVAARLSWGLSESGSVAPLEPAHGLPITASWPRMAPPLSSKVCTCGKKGADGRVWQLRARRWERMLAGLRVAARPDGRAGQETVQAPPLPLVSR